MSSGARRSTRRAGFGYEKRIAERMEWWENRKRKGQGEGEGRAKEEGTPGG